MKPRPLDRSLSGAAKEAMKEWKAKTGIRAILKKTANQKRELKNYQRSVRTRERAELRKISHGAASPVRIIDPRGNEND